MTPLKTIFLFLLISVPGWSTWTVVNRGFGSCPAGSTVCSVAITATGPGNLLAIVIVDEVDQNVISVDDGHSGAYTRCLGAVCHVFASGLSGDGWYTLSTASGITSISVTGTVNWGSWAYLSIFELGFTNGPIAFDTGGSGSTSTNNFTGVGLTLTGSNEVVVQGVSPVSSCSAVTSPYSTYADFFSGLAAAINVTSGAAPTWTCSGSAAVFTSISFREADAQATTTTIKHKVISQ